MDHLDCGCGSFGLWMWIIWIVDHLQDLLELYCTGKSFEAYFRICQKVDQYC